MTKTTITLDTVKDHIRGYGYLGGPPYTENSPATLDKLCAWSALPENTGKRIVRHVVYSRDVAQAHLRYHYAAESGSLTPEDCAKLFADRLADGRAYGQFENENTLVWGGMVYRVPYCDQVYSADIYWEASS